MKKKIDVWHFLDKAIFGIAIVILISGITFSLDQKFEEQPLPAAEMVSIEKLQTDAEKEFGKFTIPKLPERREIKKVSYNYGDPFPNPQIVSRGFTANAVCVDSGLSYETTGAYLPLCNCLKVVEGTKSNIYSKEDCECLIATLTGGSFYKTPKELCTKESLEAVKDIINQKSGDWALNLHVSESDYTSRELEKYNIRVSNSQSFLRCDHNGVCYGSDLVFIKEEVFKKNSRGDLGLWLTATEENIINALRTVNNPSIKVEQLNVKVGMTILKEEAGALAYIINGPLTNYKSSTSLDAVIAKIKEKEKISASKEVFEGFVFVGSGILGGIKPSKGFFRGQKAGTLDGTLRGYIVVDLRIIGGPKELRIEFDAGRINPDGLEGFEKDYYDSFEERFEESENPEKNPSFIFRRLYLPFDDRIVKRETINAKLEFDKLIEKERGEKVIAQKKVEDEQDAQGYQSCRSRGYTHSECCYQVPGYCAGESQEATLPSSFR